MKSTPRPRLGILPAFAVVSVLAFTGCLKDRDYEDWRRDKLSEDFAELEPAAGTYRGTLTSRQSGAALGALEVTLTPQIRAIPGMSGDKSDGAPALAARITFQDVDTRFAVTALDSYFDRTSGRLEVTLTIARSNGRSEQMVLSGFMGSDGLGGQLQITGASELAASFQLKKNPEETLTEISRKLAPEEGRERFLKSAPLRGTTRFLGGPERPVSVVLIDPNTAPEEQFLNRFSPVQVVQFTLNYGDSVKLVHEGALWDRRTGKLAGKARITRGSQSSELITECQSVQDSWSCTHQSQGLGTVAITNFESQPDDTNDGRAGEDSSPLREVLTVNRVGRASLESREVTAWLKATFAARSREQEFWDLFVPAPERVVSVSLQFGIPGQPEKERLVVLFEQAQLDLRAHTLDGRVVLRQGLGSSFIEVTLHCEGFRFPGLEETTDPLPPLACTYWSSHRPAKLPVIFP